MRQLVRNSKNRHKVLFLHASAERYGSDNVLYLLLKGLDRDRYEPIVVLPFDGPLAVDLRELGIRTEIIHLAVLRRRDASLLGLLRLLLALFKSSLRLCWLIQKEGISLVYSNTCVVLSGAVVASLLRLPHVWHVHEVVQRPPILAHILSILITRSSDIVVTISDASTAWIKAQAGRFANRIRHVPNGIDTSTFNRLPRTEAKLKLGLDPSAPVVGLIGRINRLKGQPILVQAAALLSESHPQLQFLMVGDCFRGEEHYREDLAAFIRQKGLTRVIKLLPFHTKVWEVYSALDILTVPSTEPEAFGLVAVEGMAMGVPVVGSRLGGLAEVICDGESGLLVPPGDPAALAQAIDQLLSDETLAQDLADGGRTRQRELYDILPFVNTMESILEEACQRR